MSSSNSGMLNSASSSTNTAGGLHAASGAGFGGNFGTHGPNISAASAAARRTSSAAVDSTRGSAQAESGKLRLADMPRSAMAATSCALAAISGVRNVPSHMRLFFRGSRTSDTHFPPLRSRTPWYTGCRVSRNFFRPAFRLGDGPGAHAFEGPDDEEEHEHKEEEESSKSMIRAQNGKGAQASSWRRKKAVQVEARRGWHTRTTRYHEREQVRNKKSAGFPPEEDKRRATAAAAEGKRVPSAPSSFPLRIITDFPFRSPLLSPKQPFPGFDEQGLQLTESKLVSLQSLRE
ncbi:hypothetical protein B296_00027041 [Ensete ventricosum]|uniref:Uncharacterized protein n=1 Tax=Ensete ventricosum TaxID=4639 RepID=A0A426XXQ5_ENSVE|nr:hypothetical protein B296_00027041 [Ensete ventricosum]